ESEGALEAGVAAVDVDDGGTSPPRVVLEDGSPGFADDVAAVRQGESLFCSRYNTPLSSRNFFTLPWTGTSRMGGRQRRGEPTMTGARPRCCARRDCVPS